LIINSHKNINHINHINHININTRSSASFLQALLLHITNGVEGYHYSSNRSNTQAEELICLGLFFQMALSLADCSCHCSPKLLLIMAWRLMQQLGNKRFHRSNASIKGRVCGPMLCPIYRL
jgi:hypothetical protein